MKLVPEISEECSKAFQKLSSLNVKNCEDFDALAKAVGYTDDNFVKFLKDTNYSEKTLENYQQYMKNANSATSAFSATLKSVAANMAIMLIINGVIKAVAWAWDELNVTVEEQEDKISELTASYEGLKSEYQTLSEKQDLTDAEKRRLEYLEKRLELDQKILDAETKAFHQNKVGTNWIDIIDNDSLRNKRFDEENPFSSNSFANLSGKYNTLMNSYEGNEASGNTKAMTVNLNELTKLYDTLIKKEGEFLQNREDAQAAIDSGTLTGNDLKEAQEQLQYWDEQYRAVSQMTVEIAKLNGTYSEYAENVENTDDIVLPEPPTATFDPSTFSESISALSQLQATYDDFYNDVVDKSDFTFDITDIEKLREAFGSTGETFEEFEELATSSSTTADELQKSFDGVLNAFITSNNMLDGLNSSTRDQIVSQLELQGVMNASEIITDEVASVTEMATNSNLTLANAADDAYLSLLNEAGASDNTRMAIYSLASAEIMYNNSELDVQGKIEALANLAKAYNDTATEALLANAAMSAMSYARNTAAKPGMTGAEYEVAYEEAYNSKLQEVLDDAYTSMQKFSNSTFEFGQSATNAAKTQDRLAKSTEKATDALEKQKEALEKTKSEYEEIGSAIIAVFDDEIDKLKEQEEALQDTIDKWEDLGDAIQWFIGNNKDTLDDLVDELQKINDELDKQLTDRDNALAAINNVFNTRIEALQKEKEALTENNELEEKQIELEKKKAELQELKSRKSVMLYEKGKGFVYHTDDSAINAKQEEIADLEAEIEADLATQKIDEEISRLEDLQQAWADIPDAYEKAMEQIVASGILGNNWDSLVTGDSSKDLLKNFQEQYTGLQSNIASNETQIEDYENQQDQLDKVSEFWEDATEAYENAQKEAELNTFFGSNKESDILNMSMSKWQEYVNGYADAQNKLADVQGQIANLEGIKAQWEDAIDAYSLSQDRARLASFFGSDYHYELLNNSSAWITKYVDEYASVMSQIEAVELQIKNVSEETATSVTNASNQTSGALDETGGAVNRLKDTVSGVETISVYLWSDKDTVALDAAKAKLAELNQTVGNETSGAAYEAKTKLEEFINSYSGLQESKVVTDDLINSMNGLRDTENEYLSGMYSVADGVASRIYDSRNYTEELANTTGEASTNIGGLTTSINDVKQAVDDKTVAIQNKGTIVGEVVDGEIQKFDELKSKLEEVVSAIGNVETSEETVEEEADVAVTDVNTTIATALENISQLNEALSGLETAKTNLEGMVEQSVADATVTISESGEKVEEIKLAIEELLVAISNLQVSVSTLVGSMSSLDATTLSNVIAQVGFMGDEGSTSLLGAINSTIQSIIGGDGLIAQLGVLDATQLDMLINEFGGDADSLIDSIRRTTAAIYVDGDDNCLTARINKLAETIQNINSVENAFKTLTNQVNECYQKLCDVENKLNALDGKESHSYHYIHTIEVQGHKTGTAFTGNGYATGTAITGSAYNSGSFGLEKDKPNSMISEDGYEILVRDGQYRVISQPQLIDLKKGDIIFNHEQSKAILNYGRKSYINRLNRDTILKRPLSNTGSSFVLGTDKNHEFMKELFANSPEIYSNLVVPDINYNVPNFDYIRPNESKNVSINMGNIVLNGVQDVNGLSKAIVRQLPNKIIQDLGKL